jgi:hypothetical protein
MNRRAAEVVFGEKFAVVRGNHYAGVGAES